MYMFDFCNLAIIRYIATLMWQCDWLGNNPNNARIIDLLTLTETALQKMSTG